MGLNKTNQFVTVLEVSRCLDVQKDIEQLVPSGDMEDFLEMHTLFTGKTFL